MNCKFACLVMLGTVAMAAVGFASDGKEIFAAAQQGMSQMSSANPVQGTPVDKNFLTRIIPSTAKKGPKGEAGGCGSPAPVVVEGCGSQ